MTHFGVLVRIPSSVPNEPQRLGDAITKIMEPWQEHACTGQCPIEFMEFEDNEDEYAEEYAEKSDSFVDVSALTDFVNRAPSLPGTRGEERIVVHNGRRLVRSWHDYFRVPGSIGIGNKSHDVPEVLPRVEVPFKELHATLEEFVRDYHGARARDPVKGRFGRWENPMAKWDYWRVLSAKVPAKGRGMVDCARISQLDADVIAELTRTRVIETWADIDDVRAGRARMDRYNPSRKDPFFAHDARRTAIDHGVLACVNTAAGKDEESVARLAEFRAKGWRCVQQERNDGWVVFDCWNDSVDFAAFEKIAVHRHHPLRTWARAESSSAEGSRGGSLWTEPGEMGWFACHDAEADDITNYAKAFIQWLHHEGDREDYVVKLDCHI